MIKIVTVLGARPQFIKAAAVSRRFSEHFDEVLVHTGQHYDPNMSDVFFDELGIPKPAHHLNIGSGSHGAQTGRMIEAIENVILEEKPDFLMVYGDTNSTIAGALAATKLHISVIHVEAGLRSFNRRMPEEKNRVLTDHISDLLFVPTQAAVENLETEGLTKGVHLVGDVMYDGILHFSGLAKEKSGILEKLGLNEGGFHLCTIHRAENTDHPERLRAIFEGLKRSGETIVLPLHPRTRKYLSDYGIAPAENIMIVEPLGYLDMVRLESTAKKIVTDSGGVQKEAFFLGKPCITMRDETEWVETVDSDWNTITGADGSKIQDAIRNFDPKGERPGVFGDGRSVEKMIGIIEAHGK
jgi:UDP-GlcNAc3NAcA epimerase